MTGPLLDPFIIGLGVGGCLLGSALGIVGWILGYNAALRRVTGWMRPQVDEAYGDVPSIDPSWGDR
jgi:hypothetical protein